MNITKKMGQECTQAELEKLAADAGCRVSELTWKANDGEGTYTISAPEGGTGNASPHTSDDPAAAARRAAGLD